MGYSSIESVRLYPPFGYSLLQDEFRLTRFKHQDDEVSSRGLVYVGGCPNYGPLLDP